MRVRYGYFDRFLAASHAVFERERRVYVFLPAVVISYGVDDCAGEDRRREGEQENDKRTKGRFIHKINLISER